jgi:hypothetical protein
MPGPFTHIYTQRLLADLLSKAPGEGGVNDSFVRKVDGSLLHPLDPGMLGGLKPSTAAQAMQDWPKFAALGAIGPDLFFFLEDYAQQQIPSDEARGPQEGGLCPWLRSSTQTRNTEEHRPQVAAMRSARASGRHMATAIPFLPWR